MSQASPAAQQAARWRLVLNAAIVMAGTLLSRVLGVLREAVFARQFGASDTFGAFAATFTIIDMLYLVIIGGALGSALIPVFGRLVQEGDDERAWQLANTVLTLAFAAFVLAAAAVWLFARPLLALTVAQGYQPSLLDLAVRLLRIMLLQPLLLGIGGVMMALLQTFERFTWPAIAFNVYNLAIIATALWVVPRFATADVRVEALAWGVVAGALLYAAVQAPAVWQAGLRFKPSWNWHMPEVRRVAVLLAPRLIGQSALQLNLIVMATLISLIGPDAQAANRYAMLLLMLPHGLLAVSVGTVMFPRLSRLYAAGKLDELRVRVGRCAAAGVVADGAGVDIAGRAAYSDPAPSVSGRQLRRKRATADGRRAAVLRAGSDRPGRRRDRDQDLLCHRGYTHAGSGRHRDHRAQRVTGPPGGRADARSPLGSAELQLHRSARVRAAVAAAAPAPACAAAARPTGAA